MPQKGMLDIRNLGVLDIWGSFARFSCVRFALVAVEELNLSYYIWKPYSLLYIYIYPLWELDLPFLRVGGSTEGMV